MRNKPNIKIGSLKNQKNDKKSNNNYRNKINERIPNESILKVDFRYRMKHHLQFEIITDEQACQRDLNARFINAALYLTPFLLIGVVSRINFNQCLITFGLVLSSLCFSMYIMKKVQRELKEKKNSTNEDVTNIPMYYLITRFLIEFNLYLVTVHTINSDGQLYTDNIGLYPIIGLAYNILLSVPFSLSLIMYALNALVVLCTFSHEERFLFMRFVLNLFSVNFVYVAFVTIFCICIQFYITKGTRELWVLYDSFKVSYHTLRKNFFDNHDLPLFVVSRKQINDIVYKNKAADNFYLRIKKSKQGQDTTKHNVKKNVINNLFSGGKSSLTSNENPLTSKLQFQLNDLIDESQEELFKREIESCLDNKNKKSFDFPFKISVANDTKENSADSSFSVQEEWYIISVSQSHWKGQDTLFIQFRSNDEYFLNHFITESLTSLNKETSKVIEQIDKFCDNNVNTQLQMINDAIYKEESKMRSMTRYATKSKVTTTSFSLLPTNNETSTVVSSSTPFNNQMVKQNSNKFPIKRPNPNRILTNLNDSPNQNKIVCTRIPLYDNAIWFFFKVNLEYLYDLYLTLQIYLSLTSRKMLSGKSRMKLKDFLMYMDDYLYTMSRIKNFKINYSIEDASTEIVVSYYYLRVILFNIVLFIGSNTTESLKERVIDMNVKVMKEIDNTYVHFDISYYDDKIKINLNNVHNLLNVKYVNSCKTEAKLEQLRLKCLNIGLVTIHKIITLVYENEITMSSISNQHKISFLIKFNHNLYEANYKDIKFKDINKMSNEMYYNRILSKIYHIAAPKVMHIKNQLSKIEQFKSEQFPSVKPIINTVDEKDEENITQDIKKVHEMKNILMKQKFFSNDYLFQSKLNIRTKVNLIPLANVRCLKIEWEVNKSHLSRFTPSRFLVIHKNPYGRVHLNNLIKRQKENFLIDVAGNINKGVSLYYSMIKKGFLYDIIFFDSIHVLETIREIESKQSYPPCYCVLVSLNEKPNSNNFNDYLEKPIVKGDFEKVLKRYLSLVKDN